MAEKLKKLSKSKPAPTSFEVLPYTRKTGETVWLWACEQSCYDGPHAASSKLEAEQWAQRHVARVHPVDN